MHYAILLLWFSRSVMSDSLWPHGLQRTRLPCPSLSWSLHKLMSIELVMLSDHLILCCPLLSCTKSFPASDNDNLISSFSNCIKVFLALLHWVAAARCRSGRRRYSTSKVRSSSQEEIPHVQGKEQRLHFAGAAVKEIPHVSGKRNPSKMREGIRGQTDWNHNHRKLANLITWTTVLSNSKKLSHAVWGHPRGMGHDREVWQNVVHWRREWQTLQYSCLENPVNSMKKQKDRTL